MCLFLLIGDETIACITKYEMGVQNKHVANVNVTSYHL
uniref:Uncharacterized protein n=1 Tax=Rhizophora mucronata TaxID=61149 RepID=A0A2P2P176_RHIMU